MTDERFDVTVSFEAKSRKTADSGFTLTAGYKNMSAEDTLDVEGSLLEKLAEQYATSKAKMLHS